MPTTHVPDDLAVRGWEPGAPTGAHRGDGEVPLPVDAARTSVTAATMRAVLGQFCSGVVVVTAAGPEGPFGFTCQSFASLSLDPPLVAFFASHGSTTWPHIRQVGRFCVNVLASAHADLSSRFAVSGGDKFTGVRWAPAPSGSPILEGVCAWIDCSLEAEHPGGDHHIVVGRVEALEAADEAHPLLFYRGGYRLLSPSDA